MPNSKRKPARLIYVIVGHGTRQSGRDVMVRLVRGQQAAELLGIQARAAGNRVAYAQRADRVGRLVSEFLRGKDDSFT